MAMRSRAKGQSRQKIVLMGLTAASSLVAGISWGGAEASQGINDINLGIRQASSCACPGTPIKEDDLNNPCPNASKINCAKTSCKTDKGDETCAWK
jgi:hypothetical protein